MSEVIYFDHNADGCVLPMAWQAYQDAAECYGNPSAAHRLGRQARECLENARERVASFLGAQSRQIVWTSGGTESDALAICGTVGASEQAHVLTTCLEHPAVLANLEMLASAGRISLTVATVDRTGCVDPALIERCIRAETVLVSVVMANSETGIVQPVAEIARVCRAKRVLVHTDAVQSMAWESIDVGLLGVDFLSVSGHKLGALGGIGLLYVRSPAVLKPILRGGPQEQGIRPGTENVAGASSLAAALAEVDGFAHSARVAELRDRFECAIQDRLSGVVVLGADQRRLPNTTSMHFVGCPGDAVLMSLDMAGLCASVGSACQSGAIKPSQALVAMGLSEVAAGEVVRFSLSMFSCAEEIERAIEIVVRVVGEIRERVGLTN